MAQRAFDHWFNTLVDTTYRDRCCRKKKLRQRKSPTGNYQLDEDVWARHPEDGVMYIASVIGIDNNHRTCRVTFVDDGQTFNLPISHLRHVILEDIQHNRYVDYGRGWTEHTNTGTIVTYDRYGEQQHVQYTVTPQDVFNYFFAAEESDCIDNGAVDGTPSSIHATEEENYFHLSTNEPIWVKIPDPEVPTATYCTCPIWNVSSYAEAEKKALELCNEDIYYRDAVQRAQHRNRMKAPQQLVPSHLERLNSLQPNETSIHENIQLIKPSSPSSLTESSTSMDNSSTDFIEPQSFSDNMEENERLVLLYHEENNRKSTETRTPIDTQVFEYSCPPLNEYDVPFDKPLNKLVDQQFLLDNRPDDTLYSSISILHSEDLPAAKEVGTQTESITSLSMIYIDQTRQRHVMTSSSHTTKYCHTQKIGTKKRTNTCLSKYCRLIQHISSTIISGIAKQHLLRSRFRLYKSYTYFSTKLMAFLLLTLVISYPLIIGSSLIRKDHHSVPITNFHMISIDTIHQTTMALFVCSILPVCSILNGPSRSSFELWFYPFTAP